MLVHMCKETYERIVPVLITSISQILLTLNHYQNENKIYTNSS